jgi:hypothetical protein
LERTWWEALKPFQLQLSGLLHWVYISLPGHSHHTLVCSAAGPLAANCIGAFLLASRVFLSKHFVKTLQRDSEVLDQGIQVFRVLFAGAAGCARLFARNPQHQPSIRRPLFVIRSSRRLPDLSPQSLPVRTQTGDPKHGSPIAVHIYDCHSLFRVPAILQRVVFFIYRSQRGGRENALVLVVGEDVVDLGMVVFARDGIFDECEEGFEVGRCCWCGIVDVLLVILVFFFRCGLVGSRVPGG